MNGGSSGSSGSRSLVGSFLWPGRECNINTTVAMCMVCDASNTVATVEPLYCIALRAPL